MIKGSSTKLRTSGEVEKLIVDDNGNKSNTVNDAKSSSIGLRLITTCVVPISMSHFKIKKAIIIKKMHGNCSTGCLIRQNIK